MNVRQTLSAFALLLIATFMEVSGDALMRKAIYDQIGGARLGWMAAGMLFLFGYGFTLNLAPMEFRDVVGLYIATLFVVWQIVNYFTFKTLPTLPIMVGGGLIIAGGLLITFWRVHPAIEPGR